jgi:short subunit dehydrogenase-like uncharacterized protein
VASGLDRSFGLVVADVNDDESLALLATSTRVLISTVGPYTRYGDAVVRACAEAGTDYLDLTGEPEFVDLMYLRYHNRAVQSGARLIHACGFDSIPHDLGVQFTVEQLPRDVPVHVRGYVSLSGSFSGGTAASALEAMGRVGPARHAHRDRLAAEGDPNDRRSAIVVRRPGRSKDTGQWAVPMPTIDPEIVMMSARLLERYGPEFRYSHSLDTKSLLGTMGTVTGVALVAGAAQLAPARAWIGARVAPGTGPSEEKRASSWFTVRFFGEGGDGRVVTEVAGGDPGYGETAKMISQAALCLAFDPLEPTVGQQTTASAMGGALRTRLEQAGISFRVVSSSAGEPSTS